MLNADQTALPAQEFWDFAASLYARKEVSTQLPTWQDDKGQM